MTRENVPSIMSDALARMAKNYSRQFPSALSKAFWMLKGHPVVIYDSNARLGLLHHGLRPGDGDYTVYFTSWFTVFDKPDTQRGLDDAVEWLVNSESARALAARYETPFSEFQSLIRADSFRNRVTDIYLFYYRR